FEILAENGIENDASIFPGNRDLGGFPSFTEQKPCIIEYNGIRLNEFPIPLYPLPLLNKQIAYSGGGYFRLFPLAYIIKRMNKSAYNMCYFHIEDLLTDKTPFMNKADYEAYFKESGTLSKRLSRYFKANVGRKKALQNFDNLIQTFNFASIKALLENNRLNHTITL
ncbi:MAG: DUF3473 domain-containing protein, partial [Muribaculaceae bacterium]|nr:DUF3473 domain-containing protein [Muribaculaceae bacterium]